MRRWTLWTLALALAAGLAATATAEELVVLDTSMGTMKVRLFRDAAPKTAQAFVDLVEDGFYDGTELYRVVSGHVIQFGDGGENDRPTVPFEAKKPEDGGHAHVKGAVGLARDTDPDSGSTEIYVCHVARPHLDGDYTVFGELADGIEVLDAIAAVAVDEDWVGDEGTIAFHHPKEPVTIERAWVERDGDEAPAAPEHPPR
jgi:cyclophilin family peptidyl-prolyl cis-trans isomerase